MPIDLTEELGKMTAILVSVERKKAKHGPDTLNYYSVYSSTRHENGYYTVIVERPEGYVVATWWPDLGTRWQWGHYIDGKHDAIDTLVELRKTYAEVLVRNGNRG